MRANYNRLTNNQMKLVGKETEKYFNTLLDKYNRNFLLQMLCVLHFVYGFGQKRLVEFVVKFHEMQENEIGKYELENSETPWLCEKLLTDAGIDVEGILNGKS